jgi:hypothetical protein
MKKYSLFFIVHTGVRPQKKISNIKKSIKWPDTFCWYGLTTEKYSVTKKAFR